MPPTIAGIANRNENSAAFFGDIPSIIPVVIVTPERLMPGSIANACEKPMIKADAFPRFIFLLIFSQTGRNKMIPVVHNKMHTRIGLELIVSTLSLSSSPIKTTGSVPIISSPVSYTHLTLPTKA